MAMLQGLIPLRLVLIAPLPPRALARTLLTRRALSSKSSSSSSPPPPPSYLSQINGTASTSTSATDHIGPFPLPPGANSLDRDASVRAAGKKWRELKAGEKVGRAASQTSSLIVVLAGAVLVAAVIYSTSSELWSENSPTKIYEDCIDRVKENEELKAILIPPYTFHGTASSSRMRRNRRISSTLTTSPNGTETLFVRFWVEGQLPSSATDDLTYWDQVKRWIGPIIWEDSNNPGNYVPVLSKDLRLGEAEEERKRIARSEEQRKKDERGWGGWLKDGVGAWVGGIVPKREGGKMSPTTNGGNGLFTRVKRPALGEFATGECVAELKKDPTTNTFIYQQLYICIPDARSPKHYKIKIDTDIITPGEKGWDRLRFWNRTRSAA